jgi:flagellar biosynthesis/type III secretory pathway chaperone
MNLNTSYNPHIKWENLAERLRVELQEFAGLLQLMYSLEKALLNRSVVEVQSLNEAIAEQTLLVQSRSTERQHVQQNLLGDDEWILIGFESIKHGLGHVPFVMQPLFSALIHEGEALLKRIQRKGRQNQRLLIRTLETSHELLRVIQPHAVNQTYDLAGRVALKTSFRGNFVRTAV